MKHDLTASSCCPGVTLLSRELLEGNTPETQKYEKEMNDLKGEKNRKDIVKAVNTFVQGKLNTLANEGTLSSFNDTVKSKKLLNKLVTDEHYLVMNDNTLQVVDSKKDTQGKPIDLDKRSHRKLVGKYLSYLADKSNKAELNPTQGQAASDLVSYIKELNDLADEHSLAVDKLINKGLQGKTLKKVIMDDKSTYKELNKSVARALNKDLNLDSTKYSYLEADTFADLKISAEEVQANEKLIVVKGKLENTLKDTTKVTLPLGVTYTIGKTELIGVPSKDAGSYTAEVDLKKDGKPLGILTLTVDDGGIIKSQTGTINGYEVTLADGKLTVITEAQAQEDKKSDEVKGKIVSNIILPTNDTLISTVTLGSINATGSYDTATAEFKPKDSSTSLGTLTLTVDQNGAIKNQTGAITGYDVILDQTTKKLTVSKKVVEEVKVKEDIKNNENTQLFTGLTPPAGKKILDLKDKETKTKLEAVFTAIKGKSGYESIIVNNSDVDGGTINLDATIKAFQSQYMTLNPKNLHIGGKSGQPDGKIGPKTLAAMKTVLEVSDASDQGNNDADVDGGVDTNDKKPPKKEKNVPDGTEEPSVDPEKNKEKLKKEYMRFFGPYLDKKGFLVEIEEVENDSFNFYLSTNANSPDSFITIEFDVKRDDNGLIEGIRAKGHNNNSDFHQGVTYFTVEKGATNEIPYFYKIPKGQKDFLVGFDISKKKWLYDVVDAQQNQMDIDEKLKKEYLGLFKRFNNNNQYNVEICDPTNDLFTVELSRNSKKKPFTFKVTRDPNNNRITNIAMTTNYTKDPYNQNFTDDKNIYLIQFDKNKSTRYHNVVPKQSS